MANKARMFTFLKQEKMTDVTLTAEGKSIEAHKLILAAASSYFEELFVVLKEKHPVIVLKDVPAKYLVLMLEYVYCGEVDLDPEDVRAFNDVAKSLKIEVDFKIAGEEGVSSSSTNNPAKRSLAKDELMNTSLESIESQSESSVKVNSKSKMNRSLPAKMSAGTISKRPRDKKREMLSKAEGWPSCEFCKQTMRQRFLPYHRKHCWTNPNRVVSQCKICQHSVDTPSRLSQHMKTKHPGAAAK